MAFEKQTEWGWVGSEKQGEDDCPRVFFQKEGIDYEETFALVARLEAIRILLAPAPSKGLIFFKWMSKVLFKMGI
jgi:hypothetical protein